MSLPRKAFLAGASAFAAAPFAAKGVEAAETLVRFGVVTDLHSGRIEPKIGRYYAKSPAKLADFAVQMNVLRPDFVIELGDFKDAGRDEAETLSFIDEIERAFGVFDGPRYHVLGNHDEDRVSKEDFLARVTNHGFAKALSHYAFSAKGVRFVVLDGNFNPDGSAYCRGNFDWRLAQVPPDQLAWLERELAGSREPVVVFCHQRMDAPGNPHNLVNAAAVRAVLEKSGKVIAVFQGHHHVGARTVTGGIPYVTFKAAVEGGPALDDNAFALVEIRADRTIAVTGFGRESR